MIRFILTVCVDVAEALLHIHAGLLLHLPRRCPAHPRTPDFHARRDLRTGESTLLHTLAVDRILHPRHPGIEDGANRSEALGALETVACHLAQAITFRADPLLYTLLDLQLHFKPLVSEPECRRAYLLRCIRPTAAKAAEVVCRTRRPAAPSTIHAFATPRRQAKPRARICLRRRLRLSQRGGRGVSLRHHLGRGLCFHLREIVHQLLFLWRFLLAKPGREASTVRR